MLRIPLSARATFPDGASTRTAVDRGDGRATARERALFAAADESTRDFYERQAEAYAAATRHADVRGVWDAVAARVPRGGALLDLGCGGGRDLRRWCAMGYQPVGLERSAALARIARAASGAPVAVADFAAPPFAPETFDGVVAVASLLHAAPWRLAALLARLRGLLRARAPLVASFKTGAGSAADADGRYTAYYEPPDLRDVFARAGYRVAALERSVECRGAARVPWLTVAAERA